MTVSRDLPMLTGRRVRARACALRHGTGTAGLGATSAHYQMMDGMLRRITPIMLNVSANDFNGLADNE